MATLKLAHQAKELIAKGETEEAIELLKEALQGHKEENAILNRAGQHYSLLRDIRKGTTHWDQLKQEKNEIHEALLHLADVLIREEVSQIKVFISYNREPDSLDLAKEIHRRLKKDGFQHYMDLEDTPIGTDWELTIFEEIKKSQYFILLLSERANVSEMVITEVEKAYEYNKKNTGWPRILPIRLDFPISEELNVRLDSRLKRLQQVEWKSEQDNEHILQKVWDVLYEKVELSLQNPQNQGTANLTTEERDKKAPTPVAPLEVPRGGVRLDSKYYIKRLKEDDFIRIVENPGALLRIRGPRQYGKTSLLTRVINHAAQQDYDIVAIDFQELDEEIMADQEKLLWEFCSYFADELDCEDELEDRWAKKRARKQICTAFIEKDILRQRDKPLLLALDEADRLFKYKDVSTEFFLMLRSWHEKSKVPNKKEWESFRLALSYSTEAKLAIHDLNASPFNVGEEAKLSPFSREQVAVLADLHGLDWSSRELDEIMELLEGQPYLVRRTLYLLARGDFEYESLKMKATSHDGPFSDHLRHHLVNLKQFDEVVEAMKTILSKNKCKDPLMANRLSATGIVKGTPPDISPANGLYASYFKDKL